MKHSIRIVLSVKVQSIIIKCLVFVLIILLHKTNYLDDLEIKVSQGTSEL
jgi:hypothetical protein